ncbi:MAG: GGDEF domain-containing protein [Candidatus Margulisbacteria bacterium]|jgi:diguanylate cyclase|nr:GGDEF domain-containing protein [Candidatus Margulisiibacteriota bacterium]
MKVEPKHPAQRDRRVGYAALMRKYQDLRAENLALRQQVQELNRTNNFDQLTGLYNRRGFMTEYYRLVEAAYRYERGFSLALIDIDYFKKVNDGFGHAAGDRALEIVASVFRKNLRSTDIAGRFGGDELIILLDGTLFGQAFTPLESIRKGVAETPIRLDGRALNFTVSIGVTTLGTAKAGGWIDKNRIRAEKERLLDEADTALYFSKFQGRNQTNIYSPDLKELVAAARRESKLTRTGTHQAIR